MREWVRLGWHLDGMPWEAYLMLTWNERYELNTGLDDLIDQSSDAARPKEFRK